MTAREIATYVNVSKNFINRRAKKEGWDFTAKRCRGGKTHDYHISKLPEDILAQVKASEFIRDKTLGLCLRGSITEESGKE